MFFLKVKLTQRKTICSFLKIIWIAGAWLQKLDGWRSKWKGICYGDRNIWDGKQHNVGINVYITDISILFQYSFPVIHRDSEAVLKAKKNFLYIKNIHQFYRYKYFIRNISSSQQTHGVVSKTCYRRWNDVVCLLFMRIYL